MKKTNYDINDLKKKLKEYQSKMSATLEIITPAVALRYLGSNYEDKENQIKNRKLDDKTISRYMSDMENGLWEVAEAILFDDQNRMIDGQGRCTSVAKSGVPIICWVIRGIASSAFSSIDCGKKRTLTDNLSTLTVPNSNGDQIRLTRPSPVGSAINIIHNINNNSKYVDKDRVLTPAEVVDMVRKDFDYYEKPFEKSKDKGNKSQMDIWQKRINHSIPASYFAAFYYIHKRTCGDIVDSFLDVLTSNDGTTPSIVRKFRDEVIENKNRHRQDKKFLNANAIMKRIEALFTYYQQGVLDTKRDFSKKDLE